MYPCIYTYTRMECDSLAYAHTRLLRFTSITPMCIRAHAMHSQDGATQLSSDQDHAMPVALIVRLYALIPCESLAVQG